jgi:hypothetical protein
MKDTEVYAQLLGLAAPWQVADVVFMPEERSVTVHVSFYEKAQWCCPNSGKPAIR